MKLAPLGPENAAPSHDATAAPSVARTDPLGEKPDVGPPKAFTPPAPVVFKTPRGITVWLVERSSLPLVSVAVVVEAGSAQDPNGKAGLASLTADMLDEGAGKRSALDLSTAINDLGASLSTGAATDGSYASLTVLKKNFGPAFSILADVVARPAMSPDEFKRVSDLWKNRLKKRADDPMSVSSVVSAAALYGPSTSYGHPTGGLIAEADGVGLDDVRAFYAGAWRPEHMTVVASGAISRAELEQAIETELGGWEARGAAIPVTLREDPEWIPPRLVIVDRPGAPQSVIAVLRRGVAATDPEAPLLDLVNNALGGSFTSRLNQNLREEKNWTYGARSGFSETRGRGSFVARTAVETPVTGLALKEILRELEAISKESISVDELDKVKAQDRADLVETYGTLGGIAGRLSTLARLSLPPDFDEQASQIRQGGTLQVLRPLSKQYFEPSDATIVIVGPRAGFQPEGGEPAVTGVEQQLQEAGFPAPSYWNTEGSPTR
jgi:zinc protease